MSDRVVTLVASDVQSREEMSRYLRRAGFEVRRSRVSDDQCTMVWLTDPGGVLVEVTDAIIAWLADGARRCAIVVTARPAAFGHMLENAGGRLVVLPAPAFGWQIVDALWAAHRGALA